MAATNINRVVLTGNLTRDPELRSLQSGMSVCSLRIASNSRRKDGNRRVGRQAELLQRHRLGRAGRELRPLPVQGPPRLHRRPPGVARVAGPGRRQARVGRDRRRLRPVPRRPRRRPDGRRRPQQRLRPALGRSGGHVGLRAAARRRAQQRARGRRHSVLAARPRTHALEGRPGGPSSFSALVDRRRGRVARPRVLERLQSASGGWGRKTCLCRLSRDSAVSVVAGADSRASLGRALELTDRRRGGAGGRRQASESVDRAAGIDHRAREARSTEACAITPGNRRRSHTVRVPAATNVPARPGHRLPLRHAPARGTETISTPRGGWVTNVSWQETSRPHPPCNEVGRGRTRARTPAGARGDHERPSPPRRTGVVKLPHPPGLRRPVTPPRSDIRVAAASGRGPTGSPACRGPGERPTRQEVG